MVFMKAVPLLLKFRHVKAAVLLQRVAAGAVRFRLNASQRFF